MKSTKKGRAPMKPIKKGLASGNRGMDKALTFPGNYRIREGNTMNKSNQIAEKIQIMYIFGIFLGSPLLVFPAEGFGWAPTPRLYFLTDKGE
jgi:hypothetical protein